MTDIRMGVPSKPVGPWSDPAYRLCDRLDYGPWCRSDQSGSSAGCQRYWPPTWLAIRG
jgi:hypothetical protein